MNNMFNTIVCKKAHESIIIERELLGRLLYERQFKLPFKYAIEKHIENIVDTVKNRIDNRYLVELACTGQYNQIFKIAIVCDEENVLLSPTTDLENIYQVERLDKWINSL